jgi:hypothetical protein
VIFEPSRPIPANETLLAKNDRVDVLRQRRRAEFLGHALVDDDQLGPTPISKPFESSRYFNAPAFMKNSA